MISVLISLNTLVMHVTKIIFSFGAKVDMLITTIGIITITGMLGTIFGIEIVIIIKILSFHLNDQGQHLYNLFHFTMLTMPEMT